MGQKIEALCGVDKHLLEVLFRTHICHQNLCFFFPSSCTTSDEMLSFICVLKRFEALLQTLCDVTTPKISWYLLFASLFSTLPVFAKVSRIHVIIGCSCVFFLDPLPFEGRFQRRSRICFAQVVLHLQSLQGLRFSPMNFCPTCDINFRLGRFLNFGIIIFSF